MMPSSSRRFGETKARRGLQPRRLGFVYLNMLDKQQNITLQFSILGQKR